MADSFVQILGIRFFNGDVEEAIERITRNGGMVVVPAAPALTKLKSENEHYRLSLTAADLAIADSGLMVLAWRMFKHQKITRISGLVYLQTLIADKAFCAPNKILFVLPSEAAKSKTIIWWNRRGQGEQGQEYYVAPLYEANVADHRLLDFLNDKRPEHVVIGIGNGPQEKLGHFLRDNLSYRPAIHCIGAALGFLTGDQVAIPDWADKFYLGWLFRLVAQPRIFIPRLARALELPWLIFRYGNELPALKESK